MVQLITKELFTTFTKKPWTIPFIQCLLFKGILLTEIEIILVSDASQG